MGWWYTTPRHPSNLAFLPVSISPSFHLSMGMGIGSGMGMSIDISPSPHVSIFPCLNLSIFPFLNLSIFPSLHLSISPSLHLSISPFLHLSTSSSHCSSWPDLCVESCGPKCATALVQENAKNLEIPALSCNFPHTCWLSISV